MPKFLLTVSLIDKFASLCLLKYKPKVLKMGNRRSGDVLMVICSEISWCFEIDPDSGGHLESCAYSKLINLGYNSDSLPCAGGKDTESIVFFYKKARSNYDETDAINKMRPRMSKISDHKTKCKLKRDILTQGNAVGGQEKEDYCRTCFYRKSASPNEKPANVSRAPTGQMAGPGNGFPTKPRETL